MAEYSVEEELLRQRQKEEELEEAKVRDRMAELEAQNEQQNQGGRLRTAAQDLAKNYAKNVIKTAAKEEAAAAASAAGSAIVSSAPVWGPILGILLLLAALVFVVIISVVSLCGQTGTSGSLIRNILKIGSYVGISQDYCSAFQGGRSGGAGASGTVKLDIVLTSAYRPGAVVKGTGKPSAHGRGEAVDIALINPSVPEHSSDLRIAQLVSLAKSLGFVPPPGDTLDEYTTPTEGATGGHVHIEFNLKADGTSYCDGTVPNIPGDLVDIPSWIPKSGSSVWKLRPCMLDKVEALFNQAGIYP